MGKGSALLVLLGLGGLLLAISSGLKPDIAPESQRGTRKLGHKDGTVESRPVQKKANARPVAVKVDLASQIKQGMEAHDGRDQRLALETLLPELIKRDLHAAAETVVNLEPWAPLKEAALNRTAREWGRVDPDRALLWAKELPDSQPRSQCVLMICSAVAESDRERAVLLAETAGDLLDLSAMSSLVAGWVADSPKKAGEWIERRSPEERDRFWNLGVQVLAGQSPEKAATLAVERMSPGPLQDEAVISALHQWVLKDRKAAAEWVGLFPEGPFRERARGELFGTN
jgi:hypothetical protein